MYSSLTRGINRSVDLYSSRPAGSVSSPLETVLSRPARPVAVGRGTGAGDRCDEGFRNAGRCEREAANEKISLGVADWFRLAKLIEDTAAELRDQGTDVATPWQRPLSRRSSASATKGLFRRSGPADASGSRVRDTEQTEQGPRPRPRSRADKARMAAWPC